MSKDKPLKTITVDGVECVVLPLHAPAQNLKAIAKFAMEMHPDGKSLAVCRLCPKGVNKSKPTVCMPCLADVSADESATLIPVDLYHIFKVRSES